MTERTKSTLCQARMKYSPKLPKSLKGGASGVKVVKGVATRSVSDQEAVKSLFPRTYGAPIVSFEAGHSEGKGGPLNVGVVLSGGQAPGGHNVIAGIFDGIKSVHKDSRLFGFLRGPDGLANNKFIDITSDLIDQYRNSGGFDIIGSGRTKLETEDQFNKCIEVVKANNLSTIVIIGGDDSNTNAAILAEYFKTKSVSCSVLGCPKTIDGDLKNEYIETSFGFDTAVKTYAQLIGNIARDANSAKKYWHFIKLMGRSASHIGLEAALQTRPNFCLISEEVAEKKITLDQIVNDLANVIEKRASLGKNFGVAVIPEGLIEFIPEMKKLISELNDCMDQKEKELEKLDKVSDKIKKVSQAISRESADVLLKLPEEIQGELLLDRDPHGNVQVSLIETEKLLIELVTRTLKSRPSYKGKFSTQHHFFGYEGRCAHPSNFDADYGYSLGYSAAVLAYNGLSGYMAQVSGLAKGNDNWKAGGIPIVMMMNMEKRHGKEKPVIQKALVKLESRAFRHFAENRDKWATTESYLYPGAIQYFGPSEICDTVTETLVFDSMDIDEKRR
ncbi:MAG: diphosphate--fructose-6-phosphate 1-phosphotransferase [Oligoflexales bacterium]|nr:diphosphate--fructose-6-phosphate 1-phosphotransferase [Oligoflexales bacterium]